jgi:hypothetical protein
MSKYNRYQFRQEKQPYDIHPVWRGIGCLLLVIIPVLSYFSAVLVVRANFRSRWIAVPYELAVPINFSPIYQAVPALRPFFASLGPVYPIDLLVTLLFVVVGFGLLTVLYSAMYRMSGQGGLGPTDAPPIRKSPRKGYGRSR